MGKANSCGERECSERIADIHHQIHDGWPMPFIHYDHFGQRTEWRIHGDSTEPYISSVVDGSAQSIYGSARARCLRDWLNEALLILEASHG